MIKKLIYGFILFIFHNFLWIFLYSVNISFFLVIVIIILSHTLKSLKREVLISLLSVVTHVLRRKKLKRSSYLWLLGLFYSILSQNQVISVQVWLSNAVVLLISLKLSHLLLLKRFHQLHSRINWDLIHELLILNHLAWHLS